jgi:hypothetical protein
LMFLLLLYKDSYTGNFLVLFPCIYVLQTQLVHLYHSSSLLPSPTFHGGLGQFKIIIFICVQ